MTTSSGRSFARSAASSARSYVPAASWSRTSPPRCGPRGILSPASSIGAPRRESTRPLLHEMLDRVALVDDQEPFVPLDDVLDRGRLVARHDGEPVALAADALVLGQRHQQAAFAAAGRAALALERELLLGRGPSGRALAGGCDLLVDRAHQVFVPRLPLEPLLHDLIVGRASAHNPRGGRFTLDR